LSHIAARLLCSVIALPLAALPLAAQAPQKPLTVDAIFAHGSMIGHSPNELTWSPDGKHLTYLEGGELIDLDPGTGKPHVLVSRAKLASLTGEGGSETDRDHRSRYKMASYLWAPDAEHLMFDTGGRLWIYDLRNGKGMQIGSTGADSGDDPKFSPDGQTISFIRDRGLAVIGLRETGTPMNVVAPAPNAATLNGQVDWVYEEELDVRSNYFWSPDSKNLAYLQMNEASVPQYPIEDWIPTHAKVELQRYPQPGDPNPEVRVGVVSAGITFRALAGRTRRRCGLKRWPAIKSTATSTLPMRRRGWRVWRSSERTTNISTRVTTLQWAMATLC
jgi:dipeptidyl-peptidase-4